MGMFDSMYDAHGAEWQTKAYDCELKRFQVGDELPHPEASWYPAPPAYQVKVFGGPRLNAAENGYATVRDGELASVPDERNESLPLLDYHGGWLVAPKEN